MYINGTYANFDADNSQLLSSALDNKTGEFITFQSLRTQYRVLLAFLNLTETNFWPDFLSRHSFLLLTPLLGLLSATPLQAAELRYSADRTQVVGIDGLDFTFFSQGELGIYDVTFGDAPYAFTLPGQDTAPSIGDMASALIRTAFQEAGYIAPNTIRGCSLSRACFIDTPFIIGADGVSVWSLAIFQDDYWPSDHWPYNSSVDAWKGDAVTTARYTAVGGMPATIEAESMALSVGYAVEDNAAASGGQLIRRLDSGSLPAKASTQYTGPAGNYDIAVSYFDESDGRSSLAFFLNGQPLDQWIADEDPACKDCASPGESTLRTRVVARNVRLAPGDEITLKGTGDYYEYARFDKITVAPVSSTSLEAEMMALEDGYVVEGNAAASGGQLIRRQESGGYAATASTAFTGLAGVYDITVSYFDESDGISSLAFLLNGEMLDQWLADEDPLCRDCASPGESTLRTRLVAKEMRLVPGDVIALQGTGEHYEYARFDKITLAPADFATLEAELMTLEDGFVVEANAAASGGQIIRGNGPADSVTGKASAAFMGSQGTYDITVTYFDEYDGISSMAVFLNDQMLDQWLADENPACQDCASPNESTLRSRVVATGIEISPGDDIRLESTVNQYEYGRFDRIDFTLSLSP